MKVFNLFRLLENKMLEMLREMLKIIYEKNEKANTILEELNFANLSR